MTKQQILALNGVQLAFIGDTVYDLYVREDVLMSGEAVKFLQKKASSRVNAGAQAIAFDKILPYLSEEESNVARRGRNAHSRPPKNQNPGDYSKATALEALFGYLYLTDNKARLDELVALIRRED